VIERTVRQEILGLQKGQHVPADVHVAQWIGISINEKRRMRVSDKRWVTNVYPLIGWPTAYFDRPWRRQMCQQWLADNYPGRTLPRSACIGCPMHSNGEWRDRIRLTCGLQEHQFRATFTHRRWSAPYARGARFSCGVVRPRIMRDSRYYCSPVLCPEANAARAATPSSSCPIVP
jgi:hypothetical protein